MKHVFELVVRMNLAILVFSFLKFPSPLAKASVPSMCSSLEHCLSFSGEFQCLRWNQEMLSLRWHECTLPEPSKQGNEGQGPWKTDKSTSWDRTSGVWQDTRSNDSIRGTSGNRTDCTPSISCLPWHTSRQRQEALRENSETQRFLKIWKRKACFSYLTGITVVVPAR